MTTLLPPAPADLPTAPAPAPGPTAPTWWSTLCHWLAITGAAAGATSMAFGAPVRPMTVARLLQPRPGEPAP